MMHNNIKKFILFSSFMVLFFALGCIGIAKAATLPYKCPDLNGDQQIDITDLTMISVNLNACTGNVKYSALADVDGDSCLNNIDLNYIQQYFGKALKDVESCSKCPDLNGDQQIDITDLTMISANFNACTGNVKYSAAADVNGDGCLNNTDLNYIQKYFGKKLTEIGQCGGVPVLSIEAISAQIVAIQREIAALQNQVATLPYKCPDLNNDGSIDILDVAMISVNFNACTGNVKYSAAADVNGDGCLNNTDLNYIQKHFGKKSTEVTQCPIPITPIIPPIIPVPDTNYKCPDLNNDGSIDILDVAMISTNFNACTGNVKYNSSADVNGDGCLNNTDLNYIQKYFGKKLAEVTQCPISPITPPIVPVPNTNYKCPDLNNDGSIDILDVAMISVNFNACTGNVKYNSSADVNGDGCLNNTDLNYIQKYFGKKLTEVTQCKITPIIPPIVPVPDTNYKCPDLNGDGSIDINDIAIISTGYNTCSGNAKYNTKGDVNGDNCLNSTDLNYVQENFGKTKSQIPQCITTSGSLDTLQQMAASIADAISKLLEGIKSLMK